MRVPGELLSISAVVLLLPPPDTVPCRHSMLFFHDVVMRVLGELLSISAVALLVLQMRRDGVRNMLDNFNQNHRVFRVSALAASALLTLVR